MSSIEDFSWRVLTPSDAEAMRDVRLESLRYYGEMFKAFHAQESRKPLDYWREQCTELTSRCWFGAFNGKGRLIGLQGTRIWEKSPPGETLALWWGNYVVDEYRDRGAMKPLYQARLDWALARGCTAAVGYVLPGKERPLQILRELGATFMGREELSHGEGPAVPWDWYRIPLCRAKSAQLSA